MIVENDSFLTLISIPPLVLGFEICVRVVLSCFSTLTYAWGAIDPDASCIIRTQGLFVGDPVGVDSLLNFLELLESDDSLVNGRFGAHFQDLLVPSGDVTSLVLACGTHSKAPRACDPCIFLVAILICSIVFYY